MRALILSLITCVSISGCVTSPAWPEQQRPKSWGLMIQQQHNFYQISDWVYRSEQPNTQLINSLKAQNIQTIINLRSRDADTQVFPTGQFNLVHLPIHTWDMSREDLLQVMQHLQRAKIQHQKVLIHCYHGSDRTGASIAMYRIIFENWSASDALSEMKYGGYGFHPVWQNIEGLFSPENIKWIRQQLANPS